MGARYVGYLIALLLGAAPAAAWADDPPERVGRIAYVEGGVLLQGAANEAWAPAVPNYPVAAGASVATQAGARGEVQFGAVTLRLDNDTRVMIARLDDAAIALQLQQGVANVRVSYLTSGQPVLIGTPAGQVEVLAPGMYHVEAMGFGAPVRIVALDGFARVNLPRTSITVRPGEAVDVRAETQNVYSAPAMKTMFDDWAQQRDQEAAQAARYASTDMPGYQDLDAAGIWQEVPDYGAVWYPRAVPAGWAPYSQGRWAWVAPWGWTWIDDQPWGFAPFHYGRWVHVHDRWAWWPGYRQARPVYAPALVLFHDGSRPRGGWTPLGPRQAYQPHYRASPDHVQRLNVNVVPRHERPDFDRRDFDRRDRSDNFRRRDGAIGATLPRQAPPQVLLQPPATSVPAPQAAPVAPRAAPPVMRRDDRPGRDERWRDRGPRENVRNVPAPAVTPVPAAAQPPHERQSPRPEQSARPDRAERPQQGPPRERPQQRCRGDNCN